MIHIDQVRAWLGRPLWSIKNADGSAAQHLPDWKEKPTPHVLRHFCASRLYFAGMDLIAIQETLGHAWVATTMKYIHVHRTHVEEAWPAAKMDQ
ncbi:tyrosine-type recombinase/integrase [Nonomuraea sp. NPDC050383]|uniref:tyrosine-type recombinase/integrase n=1 Tax=Nonomuraea sp. NPDC050383 TaxID=3364362 RepID=UPI00378FAD66